MGWSDTHLHRFIIHGKQCGIYQPGGLWFSGDANKVKLAQFGFRVKERFLYEYDFGDRWQHQIRVEAILTPRPNRFYPVCIGGKRACPPEDCGGTWAFMEKKQENWVGHIAFRLSEIIDAGDIRDHIEEIHELRHWLMVDSFDRHQVNHRLKQYATGGDQWMFS